MESESETCGGQDWARVCGLDAVEGLGTELGRRQGRARGLFHSPLNCRDDLALTYSLSCVVVTCRLAALGTSIDLA